MKALIFSAILFFMLLTPFLTLQIRPLQGTSMQPTFYDGDAAILSEADLSQILEGKIIVYRYNSTKTVCHRVIEDNIFNLVTKGDNNRANDKPITRNQIIGEVTAFIPSTIFKIYTTSLILSYVLFMVVAVKTVIQRVKK